MHWLRFFFGRQKHHAAPSRMEEVMELKVIGFVSNIPLLERMPPFWKAKLQQLSQKISLKYLGLGGKSFRSTNNLQQSKQHKSDVDWRFAGFQSLVILQASYVRTLSLITHSQPSVSAASTFKQTRFVMSFSCSSRCSSTALVQYESSSIFNPEHDWNQGWWNTEQLYHELNGYYSEW